MNSCDFRISNEPTIPVDWYVFPSSTYQVRDILDSLVSNRPELFYDSCTFFKEIHLNIIDDTDTIVYYMYFSGDELDWVTNPDSTFLALKNIFKKKRFHGDVFSKKALSDEEKEKYHDYFSEKIYQVIDLKVKQSTSYLIKSIDENKFKWLICRDHLNHFCDTFWLIREQQGRNAGYYILSDTLIEYEIYRY